MRNRPLLFALAISTIVVGGGFVLSTAPTRAAQHVTTESSATSPVPAHILPHVRPDPFADHAMRHLERHARVDMILYRGKFGQPVQGHRLDAVAVAVVPNSR